MCSLYDQVMKEGDSWEAAALSLRKKGITTAPVVDSDGYLVAILNPSDLLQEMEIEVTRAQSIVMSAEVSKNTRCYT